MFEKYGEFDSYEEINARADELLNAGVREGIRELAKENGIPEEYADLFMEGETPFLTDAATAAVGKIEIEREETVLEGVLEDWISYIEAECMEDEALAMAVRSKKKSLNGCIAELILASLLNQKQVDRAILDIVEKRVKEEKIDLKKQMGIEPGWLRYTKLGFPGSGAAKKLIRKYYLGEVRA
jgi:hypothetical protein